MGKLDYAQPVALLLTLGKPEEGWEWPDYPAMGIGPEQIGDLVRLVQDDELWDLDGDDPEAWAPIHAWRALGQLRAEAAVAPLLALLRRIDEHEDEWVGEEVPVALGMIGPAAIPQVSAYLAEPGGGLWARAAASGALAEIAKRHPDARDACLAALTEAMAGYAANDPALNGSIISDLIDVHGVEAAPVMEAAFAADSVDVFLAGDWEDVQIELGLLAERKTPAPNLLRSLLEGQRAQHGGLGLVSTHGLRPVRRADKERKAKRKQQKQARRQQRKRRK